MSVQDKIHDFVKAAAAAYDQQVSDPAARDSVRAIFEVPGIVAAPTDTPGTRLPVCALLDEAADPRNFDAGPLRDLVAAFRALEPHLSWYKRDSDPQAAKAAGANAAFADGHANAMIVGPSGLVPQDEIWLGVSLLAPGVRYPDHRHPPEETYLVLSDGDFFQDGRGWFSPGMGGTFYNPPGILHAMRSDAAPLFAVWALRAG